ncbi:MAG TPA: biotin--[acetyl-CoA-carboxylase] ligase [Dissulfurispiraceae bacterium]|nr:biotin--[acetyl-CoA-carboxylase] ligase [Dissulfurispiraceae bacterium]
MAKKKVRKEDIVQLLKESGGFLSGSGIASTLGVTRAAVWKTIVQLRKGGYLIDSFPAKGYCLLKSPDFCIQELRRTVPSGNIIGREIFFFESTTSTNALGMELASNGCQEGTVVMADTQTGGKGRLGRCWMSPPGKNIYMSIVLRPSFSPRDATSLTLMSAVSCVSAIRRVTSVPATIKWPNDIMVKQLKLGGILTEIKADIDSIAYAVVGIGINVNLSPSEIPDDIRLIATSVMDQSGGLTSRTELAAAILEEIDKWYSRLVAKGKQAIIDEWISFSSTIGERVIVSTGSTILEGLAETVDDDGLLILKLDDGRYSKISAGDVKFARTKGAE